MTDEMSAGSSRVSAPRGAPGRRTWLSSRLTALSNNSNVRIQCHCVSDQQSVPRSDILCSGRRVNTRSGNIEAKRGIM
jgi:hypothetical protein